MSGQMQDDDTTLDRRKLLAGLSTAATMGLAGCGGGGGGGQDDGGGGGQDDGGGGGNGGGSQQALGERVPKVNIDFFVDLAKFYETYAELIQQTLTERLDMNVEATPRDTTSLVFDLYADNRTSMLPLYTYAPDLSPHFNTRRVSAEQAGDGIGAAGQNTSQWPNCDFSVRAHEQAKAVDMEERQRLLTEAWSIGSYNLSHIPTSPAAEVTGYRTDMIQPDTDVIWQQPDFSPHQWETFLHITPVDGTETIQKASYSAGVGELINPYLNTSVTHWSNGMVHSPLLRIGPDYEISNNLANTIEFEDDGSTVIVELISDARFQNGDPVTAEDVKFTYDYMVAGSASGQFTFTPALPILNEIVEVDDRTVEFDLESPYAPLTAREFWTWGIQDKDDWMGVLSEFGVDSWDTHEKEFGQFSDVRVPAAEFNGSGPYMIENLVEQQSIRFVPWDDHPVYDPPELAINEIQKSDPASRFASLQAGEVSMAGLAPQQAQQIEDDPNIEIISTPTLWNQGFLTPNCAAPPTKFTEFRRAVAAVLNRQEMVQVAHLGAVEPDIYAGIIAQDNPWRPDNDMLYQMAPDATGSGELGRAILEADGWGWDDDGNLRYPEGADLEPLWEKNGTPDPADYPCLNESGYQKPEGYEMTEDQVPGYGQDPTDPWPDSFQA